MTSMTGTVTRRRAIIGSFCLAILVLVMTFQPPGDLPVKAWYVLGVVLVMATLWLTEIVPVAATSLLPVILLPVMGVSSFKEVSMPYAHPLIFLFLGGFIVAIAIERWNLHRRIALSVLAVSGTRSDKLVLGFMLASAFLSMWVSNTATALMMLPIGLSLVTLMGNQPEVSEAEHAAFSKSLLIGIAFACSIGGNATLVGSPPNGMAAAYLSNAHGLDVSFAKWLAVGLPVTIVLLPVTWWLLNWAIFRVSHRELPNAQSLFKNELRALGRLSGPEKRVAAVFGLMASLWVLRPVFIQFFPVGTDLTDGTIALASAFLLFLIPSGLPDESTLLDWKTARMLPWDVLLLFGGGLSIAAAIQVSGLAEWIGSEFERLSTWPILGVIFAITIAIKILTEFTSNTATAAAFLPIAGAVAVSLDISPALLCFPVALAASCAFMLPVATPPNAIVYSSNALRIADMAKAGLVINILATLLIPFVIVIIVPMLYGH